MAIKVPGDEEEAAATATARPLTSPIWDSFTYNAAAAGGAPTATCGECGMTLCAGGSNGTSHLHRHAKSKRCQQQRAAKLVMLRQLTARSAAEPSSSPTGDQPDFSKTPVAAAGDEEGFYFVDGVNIAELYDKLDDEGLVDIEQLTNVAAGPQAVSSSTRWFLKKTKERKKAESKKRCASDDESSLDLSAQADFSFREKRITWEATAGSTATIQDYSSDEQEHSGGVEWVVQENYTLHGNS